MGHSGQRFPTLTTADKTRHSLKLSKSTSTQLTLTRLGGGELTGDFVAIGVTYEDDTRKLIVVGSIHGADASARP